MFSPTVSISHPRHYSSGSKSKSDNHHLVYYAEMMFRIAALFLRSGLLLVVALRWIPPFDFERKPLRSRERLAACRGFCFCVTEMCGNTRGPWLWELQGCPESAWRWMVYLQSRVICWAGVWRRCSSWSSLVILLSTSGVARWTEMAGKLSSCDRLLVKRSAVPLRMLRLGAGDIIPDKITRSSGPRFCFFPWKNTVLVTWFTAWVLILDMLNSGSFSGGTTAALSTAAG